MTKGLHAIETASRDEIAALQIERLKWTLHHVYTNVPHYKARFDAAGVRPDDFKSLDDLRLYSTTSSPISVSPPKSTSSKSAASSARLAKRNALSTSDRNSLFRRYGHAGHLSHPPRPAVNHPVQSAQPRPVYRCRSGHRRPGAPCSTGWQ